MGYFSLETVHSGVLYPTILRSLAIQNIEAERLSVTDRRLFRKRLKTFFLFGFLCLLTIRTWAAGGRRNFSRGGNEEV